MALPRKTLPAARVSDESHRVTTFELFFDLAFVFAFTRVTGFMAHEHSFTGILQGMIIVTLLWWSWVSFSRLSNQTHVDEGIMRLGLSVVMMPSSHPLPSLRLSTTLRAASPGPSCWPCPTPWSASCT